MLLGSDDLGDDLGGVLVPGGDPPRRAGAEGGAVGCAGRGKGGGLGDEQRAAVAARLGSIRTAGRSSRRNSLRFAA